jgi:EAL domain-containing protein (putative c-di-GMP-specific phosphodiesterase class I)
LANRDEANGWLAKISGALAPRYVLPGAVISVRFAIGYAVGGPGMDALTMIRRAGAALKRSRSTKLREIRESDEAAEAQAVKRIRLTNELQQAVVHKEFAFHYQPKVDLATNEFTGAEALVRWHHSLFGELAPASFISAAEETGIILDIGAWGLREVSTLAASLNRTRTRPLSFALNVSTIEFMHRDMVQFVAGVLAQTGAHPQWLTLELTESLMAESSPRMLQIFRDLRALGVGLAVDDFGTGYSSLRYLEQFPVTEVKIDRSFVESLAESASTRIIVEAVIRLGRELNLTVTAEGVETDAQRAILADMGCSQAQGNLFSRPLPTDSFAVLMQENARP